MHILELRSSNIKRISAVQISVADGLPVITIGGENGAGKSSVIDSIVYALGGQALIPAEPIRAGETEAEVYLDLGDLVVTRKFRREKSVKHGEKFLLNLIAPHVTEGVVDHLCDDTCLTTFGPTTSTLVVKNKDGAKYPTPQAILDRLLGVLTFDPQDFSRMPAAKQLETLRALVGIDPRPLEEARKTAMALRKSLKSQLGSQQALLDAAKHYDEAPLEEIPASNVAAELAEHERLRKVFAEASSVVLQARNVSNTYQTQLESTGAEIEKLENRVAELKGKWRKLLSDKAVADDVLHAAEEDQNTARAAVPDPAVLQARIKEVEDINSKVRANVVRKNIVVGLEKLQAAVDRETASITKLDEAKASLLADAKFPVAGLGLTDDGVTFGGVPFEQASTSEQIRVSVAIGLALNPKIRVLLVRNGNALDKKSMIALTEQAREAKAQVWVEYVTDDASQVAVMIEDGHVANV